MIDAKDIWGIDEEADIREEAAACAALSAEERMAVFVGLLRTVDAIWASLTEEERLARLRIGESLEPRPEPWWRNVRASVIPVDDEEGIARP